MQIDNYMKIVFSIIAISLAIIAVHSFSKSAVASQELCGQVAYNPCYVVVSEPVTVEAKELDGMRVYITNHN